MSNSHRFDRTVNLAITGASGAPYGLRLPRCLVAAHRRVHVMNTR